MSRSRLARSPLSIAEDAFRALTREPHPLALPLHELISTPDDATTGQVAELATVQVGVGEVGGAVVALDEVRRWVRRPDTATEVKTRAWTALTRRAQRHGGAWTVGAVGVALPRLVRLSDALAEGDPRVRHELDAEVLLGFLTALSGINPDSMVVFPRLLRAAREAGQAWLRRQRPTDALTDDSYQSMPPPSPWAHPDLVLADAVNAGVLTAGEADLISATRLDTMSLAQAAARLHTTAEAVRKRRSRAETRLVAAIRGAHADLDPGTDPCFAAAVTALPLPARSAAHRRHRVYPATTTPQPTVQRRDRVRANPVRPVSTISGPSYPRRDLSAFTAQPSPPVTGVGVSSPEDTDKEAA